MSRKTIAVVMAVIGAILGVLVSAFGLSINATVLATGIAAVLVWVFGEAKADLAKIGAQAERFKDPKFWLTMVNAVVTALGSAGLIPVVLAESIIAVLTLIIGVLFKTDSRLVKA